MRRPRRHRNPSRRARRLTPLAPSVGRDAETAAAIGPAFCPALHVESIFASRFRERASSAGSVSATAAVTVDGAQSFELVPGHFVGPICRALG